MKSITRFTLILTVIVMYSSICLAQDNSRVFIPPPLPPVESIPSRWHSFSQITGFGITMPGEPEASTRLIESPFGQLTQHTYLLTTETGNYVVSYVDFPSPLSDPNVVKSALDSGRDNILAKNKGMKLLQEQEIKIAGYAGQELLIEHGDMFLRQRTFIAGKRFYQIALAVPIKVAFKSGQTSTDPTDFTDFYQMIVSKFLDSARTYNSYGYGGGSAFKLDEELKKAVRGGVLNGKAISLPKPSYPNEAMAAGASGTVTVQVLIDEDGTVIWAKAVSGHPLLQEAARKAALKAKFAPFKLQGQPAKVTGVLTYNFAS